ncbi:MAG: hypothetical protein AAFV51_04465, partial [Pseudomonadota bacterium]
MIRPSLALAALSLAACANAAPRPVGAEARREDEAAVLAVVERFLSVIETRDAAVWEDLLLPGSGATIQIEQPDGAWRFLSITRADTIDFMKRQPPGDESELIGRPGDGRRTTDENRRRPDGFAF